MKIELLIRIGAAFHFVCALFHLFFPRMFKWDERLAPLPGESRRVIGESLHVANSSAFLFWLVLAYVPLVHAEEMLTTPIGTSLLTCIVVFWVIRIFIVQPMYSGFKTRLSILRAVFFLCGSLMFVIPWLHRVIGIGR
jgi:hypothetical protein